MKKITALMAMLLLVAMFLAACAPPAAEEPAAEAPAAEEPAAEAPAAEAPAAEAPAAEAPAAEAPAAKAGGPITLPSVGPLTGPDGVDGQGGARAVELAVKQANAAGGVCGGRELVFVGQDTKSDPKEGANIASLLCGDETVFGAVADYNSSVALAEAPVFNECKISQINFYAAAPDIPKRGGQYTLRVYPPGQNMSIYIADWAINKKGYKNLVVLYENTDYGKGLYDAFMAEVAKTDAKVLASEAVLKDQTDLSAVISKFKSLEPDAVIGMVQYQVGAYFQTQAKNIGWDVPLYGSDGLFAPEIIKLAGEAVEGTRTVAAYTVTSTDPVVSAFVKAFNEEFGENPNNPAGYAYDAANAIIAGLNATNCESREALNAWLKANMTGVKGVTGVITLDADGDRSFAPGMYTPIEIKDGAWVEVVE